ncbi:hypothetical protein Q7O_004122 [Pectobacterium carotovorum subsp. carotovorum PCCS1]|nr:hypothetical protein [Pectobacterium carotovorum subsp. carotovorum PCCS1]
MTFVTVFRCPPSNFEKFVIGQKSPCFVGNHVGVNVNAVYLDE